MNAILIDCEFVCHTVADLSAFLRERLHRSIPEADLARWLECAALDGGIKAEQGTATQVYLFHEADTQLLDGFRPHGLTSDIDGKAFNSPVGEFLLAACPAQPDLGTKETLLCETLQALLRGKQCERMVVVADLEAYGERIHQLADDYPDAPLSCLTLSPTEGTPLPYSLMAALGIRGDELP